MALKPQMKRFCEEYVANGYNGTRAYMEAYACSQASAQNSAHRMMKMPEVVAYIAELEKDIYEANRINAEHIANELATMAFGKVSEETGISHQTKLKALDLLQKQVGLQTQNIKADVNQDIIIRIKGEKPNEGT